jgi:hypothetical protein
MMAMATSALGSVGQTRRASSPQQRPAQLPDQPRPPTDDVPSWLDVDSVDAVRIAAGEVLDAAAFLARWRVEIRRWAAAARVPIVDLVRAGQWPGTDDVPDPIPEAELAQISPADPGRHERTPAYCEALRAFQGAVCGR